MGFTVAADRTRATATQSTRLAVRSAWRQVSFVQRLRHRCGL